MAPLFDPIDTHRLCIFFDEAWERLRGVGLAGDGTADLGRDMLAKWMVSQLRHGQVLSPNLVTDAVTVFSSKQMQG